MAPASNRIAEARGVDVGTDPACGFSAARSELVRRSGHHAVGTLCVMLGSKKWVAIVLATVVLAFAAAALALPSTHHGMRATTAGPGMMNGYAGGMTGGSTSSSAAGQASANGIGAVSRQVESWLRSRGFAGFHVSEVMAFSNNDYVAVKDARGKPAFELLAWPGSGWLMEEPASMMWNTRFGMMGGLARSWPGGGMMGSMMGGGMMSGSWNSWYGGGHGKVTSVAAAARIANRWLAQARPGERVDGDVGGMGRFPGYYTLDTVHRGKTAGMLSVNASTGAVWYHGWHGRFLGEREF